MSVIKHLLLWVVSRGQQSTGKNFAWCFGHDETLRFPDTFNCLFEIEWASFYNKQAAWAKCFRWGYWQKQPLEVFCGKGVLRNFAKFTGKHLCQSFFLNKVAGLRPVFCTKNFRYYDRCCFLNSNPILASKHFLHREEVLWETLNTILFV